MGCPEVWVDRSGTGFWPEKNRLHKLDGLEVQSEIDAVGQIGFRLKCYTPMIVFRTAASKYKCTTGANSVVFVVILVFWSCSSTYKYNHVQRRYSPLKFSLSRHFLLEKTVSLSMLDLLTPNLLLGFFYDYGQRQLSTNSSPLRLFFRVETNR